MPRERSSWSKQLAAPESLTVSSREALLEGREVLLLPPSCRNELARFSSTFLRPWHRSSQSPYFFKERSPEFPTAGSTCKLSVVVGAAVAGAAGAGAVVAAGRGVSAGAEPARGCGASDLANADSSRDLDGGPGLRARFADEFTQKEILAVPSARRAICRCKGHCPR